MRHYDVTDEEIRNSPYHRMIHDSPAPRTLFDAVAYDGQVLPPNPRPFSFLVSTSSWDVVHLRVLHVLCFNALPLSRIFPQQHTINEQSELALRIRRLFALSRDDVRSGSYDLTEMTYPFYSELSVLLRTNQKTPSPPMRPDSPRPTPIMTQFRPSTRAPNTILGSSFTDSTTGSTFSYVSSGDTGSYNNVGGDNLVDTMEVVTNNMIVAFTSFLSNLFYPVRNPLQHRPEFNAKPDNFTLVLMGGHITSINDGSGWKTRYSKTYSQWVRTGGAPLITIEVCCPVSSSISNDLVQTLLTWKKSFSSPCSGGR